MVPEDCDWVELCRAEESYYEARIRFVGHAANKLDVLSRALDIAHERGTALRALQTMDESEVRPLLPKLVDLASRTHSNVGLVRDVISRYDRGWLRSALPRLIRAKLLTGGEEEFRRLAELLARVDPPELGSLVAQAKRSDDAEIREVAQDFTGAALRPG